MRVLNDTEDVSEWVDYRSDANPAADILHGLVLGRAETEQTIESYLRIQNPQYATEPQRPPAVL
jgi:hypothetical protein